MISYLNIGELFLLLLLVFLVSSSWLIPSSLQVKRFGLFCYSVYQFASFATLVNAAEHIQY
jgi:hypothetical protein